MINLNPRYAMIDYNINLVKKFIKELDYEALLDFCPRIVIPKGSLLYHSTKLSSIDIENIANDIKNNLYPPHGGCQTCQFYNNVPYENIGDKPRIMELTVNPNQKRNQQCTCQTGRQKRLYGNFNFSGNYDIALGKTVLKGTEILINMENIVLVDLNYLSIELGFSPKRFSYNGEQTLNGFGAQKNWTDYCYKHNLDGLVMVDIVDQHGIDLTFKTNLSCYNYFDTKQIVCPEFVLISTLGPNVSVPIGTEKLKILGMVDLYDNNMNVKLNRDQAEELFQLFFRKLQTNLYPLQLDIIYKEGVTLFKSLVIDNGVKDVNYLFEKINAFIKNKGDQSDFYITANDIYYPGINIYQPDITYLETYNRLNLELDVPTLPENIELYTEIIIKNIIPRDYYYYKDGDLTNYVSDRLFDLLLTDIANKIKVNKTLYVNYNQLSSIKAYKQYTLEYFMDALTDKSNIKEMIKDFMDDLELELMANFFINCYIKIYNLNINKDVEPIIDLLYDGLVNSDVSLVPFRNKTWQEFKTAYLESPDTNICYTNDYIKTINKAVSSDNTTIQHLYGLFEDEMVYDIDDILINMDNQFTKAEQDKINIDLFNYYTTLPLGALSKEDLFITFNNFINHLYQMTM